MNFATLRSALSLTYSHEACLEILAETAIRYRELTPFRWYFLLLNRIFVQVIDNPELYEADHIEPLWITLSQEALAGIEAIEIGDQIAVCASADRLTEAYCAVP